MNGVNDYLFEDKNRWRIMVWSRIVGRLKRCGKKPQDCLVVYLAGPQDLDRAVAMRKGFLPSNLIAVEIDGARVDGLRDQSVLTIRADMFDTLMNWRHKRKPDVVYADLCSNLNPKTIDRLCSVLLTSNVPHETVVIVNFQRGREAKNVAMEFLQSRPDFAARLVSEFDRGFGILHRGLQFLGYLAGTYAGFFNWKTCSPDELASYGAAQKDLKKMDMLDNAYLDARERGEDVFSFDEVNGSIDNAMHVIRLAKPEVLSYKGNRVTMDTLVFYQPAKFLMESIVMHRSEKTKLRSRKTTQQVAAVMAHRTMRLGSAENA